MEVKFGQQRREGIRVRHFSDIAIVPTYAQPIVACFQMAVIDWQKSFEDSPGLHEFSREGAALDDHTYGSRVRLNRANQNAFRAVALYDMRAQQTKRFAVLSSRERGKFELQFRRRFLWYSLTRVFHYFGQISLPYRCNSR